MDILNERFQKIVQKTIENDLELQKMYTLYEQIGNKLGISSVINIAMSRSFPQIMNPIVPDAFYPSPNNDFIGDFYFGEGSGFIPRIDVNNLTKGFLNLGTIGAGKTNQDIYYLQQFYSLGKTFLHLGFKQNIRHYKEIPILTFIAGSKANFCWQVFNDPPLGVDVVYWDMLTTRVFCGTTYILDAGQSALLQVVTEIRKEGKYVNPITILEKIKKIKTYSSREAEWKATLINRFTELNISCGRMFIKQVEFNLARILEHHSIELELDQAGTFAPFFATMAIAYLYEHRKANNIRGDDLITPIVCDELHSLVNTTMMSYFPKAELPLLDYMRKGREFGIGLIFFANEIKTIPSAIKTQANVKAIMRTVDFNEIKEMGSSMNLTEEQMELCLDLPVGWVIIKMPEKPAFLTYFPLIDIKKDVTDD